MFGGLQPPLDDPDQSPSFIQAFTTAFKLGAIGLQLGGGAGDEQAARLAAGGGNRVARGQEFEDHVLLETTNRDACAAGEDPMVDGTLRAERFDVAYGGQEFAGGVVMGLRPPTPRVSPGPDRLTRSSSTRPTERSSYANRAWGMVVTVERQGGSYLPTPQSFKPVRPVVATRSEFSAGTAWLRRRREAPDHRYGLRSVPVCLVPSVS